MIPSTTWNKTGPSPRRKLPDSSYNPTKMEMGRSLDNNSFIFLGKFWLNTPNTGKGDLIILPTTTPSVCCIISSVHLLLEESGRGFFPLFLLQLQLLLNHLDSTLQLRPLRPQIVQLPSQILLLINLRLSLLVFFLFVSRNNCLALFHLVFWMMGGILIY